MLNINIWGIYMKSIWEFFVLFLQIICEFEIMSKRNVFAGCPEKTLGNLI